jgi:hypothetical protein
MLVGYMRVSSDSDRQSTDLQRDALLGWGLPWRPAVAARAARGCGRRRARGAAAAGGQRPSSRVRVFSD